jgi:hypothetical protein
MFYQNANAWLRTSGRTDEPTPARVTLNKKKGRVVTAGPGPWERVRPLVRVHARDHKRLAAVVSAAV